MSLVDLVIPVTKNQKEWEKKKEPPSSISLSVKSSSSSRRHLCPSNQKASLETREQDSIFKETSKGQELATWVIETPVSFRQQVMSSFLRSLSFITRQERPSSVTVTHLLRLTSLREMHSVPIAFNPSQVTEQPSNLIDCNAEETLFKLLAKSNEITYYQKNKNKPSLHKKGHDRLREHMYWLINEELTEEECARSRRSRHLAPLKSEVKPLWVKFWQLDASRFYTEYERRQIFKK